jgi:cell division protein FtsB
MENDLETKGTHQEDDVARPERVERPALRLPLALTLISLLIWFGFQTVALVLERNNLIGVSSNFAAAMQEAEKMRAQLQTLITQTAELASKGNAGAKAAIEELQKKGIPLASILPPGK